MELPELAKLVSEKVDGFERPMCFYEPLIWEGGFWPKKNDDSPAALTMAALKFIRQKGLKLETDQDDFLLRRGFNWFRVPADNSEKAIATALLTLLLRAFDEKAAKKLPKTKTPEETA